MHTKFMLLVMLAVSVVFVKPQLSNGEEPGKSPPPQLAEMLGWLPSSSETLIVVNGPFELLEPFDDREAYGLSLRTCCHGVWVPEILGFRMFGKKITLAVEGSRNFRGTNGLGLMSYDGCHLLRFEEGSDADLQEALKASAAKADETLAVLGQDALLFRKKAEGTTWTVYLARLAPDVLLCTTDRESLETAIVRHRTAPKDGEIRAFPNDLPEWQHIDFSAPVWGLRHFSRDHINTDITTPFAGRRSDSIADPHGIGFTFEVDKTRQHIRLRYLTGAEEPVKLVSSVWINPPENLTPNINLAAPGIVDVTATVGDGTSPGIFEFVLLLFLGHGIAV